MPSLFPRTPPPPQPSTSPDDASREAWLAVRALLIITTLLIAIGLTMLYSTSYGIAGLKYFSNQLIWLALGTAGGFVLFFLGYKRAASQSLWWMAGVFILLIIASTCFAPIKGAARWIRFGSFSIQPSEFAKVVVALFVAKYCSDHARTFSLLTHKRGLLPLGGAVAAVLLAIISGHDLGTTVLVASTAFATMLVGGLFWRYLIVPLLLAGLVGTYIVLFDSMRLGRVTSFMNPEAVQAGKGYQLWHSLLALGSGDWFGVGFMTSRLKAKYIPEAHTDFILAIVGEELGFLAMAFIIILYTLFGYFGLKIACRATSRLGMLLGFALTFFITIQAAINLAVVSGSAPTKGMPAPFISYGGSNIIACLAALGLLVSVAFDTIDPGYAERFTDKLFFWKKKRR